MNYVFYKEHDGKVIATETVSEEDFNRVDEAAQYVMRIYRVEEIFHMIMSALLEFNRLIFQRADQGRIAEDDILDNEPIVLCWVHRKWSNSNVFRGLRGNGPSPKR